MMARPRSSHTPEDRTRRRTLTMVVALVVVALLAWIALISAIAGGDGSAGSNEKAGDTADGQQAAVGDGTEATEGARRTTDSGDAARAPQARTPEPTAQDVPVQESPSGDWQQDEAPQGEPAVAQESNADETSASLGEDASDDASASPEPPRRQQGMDPLGKDPEPGDLTETQEERVESAADRFVTAAFGYTGNSEREYRKGILDAALARGLYRSPGGKKIQKYAKAAGEDGITAAAVMDRFEITRTDPNQVEGIAHFRVGREYNQYAEIRGESTAFTQKLTLSPAYSSYFVSWAEPEKQVEGDQEDNG